MPYNIWVAPPRGHYKVNVHTIQAPRQPNGNYNGVGIIIKEHHGRLVKALSGTMKGLSPLAVQLRSLHMGLFHAIIEEYELLTLETDNHLPYYEVTRKDGRGYRSCLWIVEQIKKLPVYNLEWKNNFRFIPDISNHSAQYLAAVGINHWNSMFYFSKPFGHLQEKMNMDMGFGPHIFQLLALSIPRDAHRHVAGFAPADHQVVAVVAVLPYLHSENGGGAE